MRYYHVMPIETIGNGGDHSPILRLRRDISAKLILQEQPKEISSTVEPVPAVVDQPQGQCLLDGVLVMETTVTCEKQVGCRAIQKTGQCCPDYKCDCQKDGRIYLNGDKLVDPETPCTVCYCQGGEILCSSVTCFHRDDCKPKYIPGRCCPEYDNCPVSIFDPSHNGNQSHNPSAPKETNAAIASLGQPVQKTVPQNTKITIKEITKPIEIRITDANKAIPIQQIFKPQATITTRIATTESTSTAITDGSAATQMTASVPTSTPIITTDLEDSISDESTSTVTITGSNVNNDSNSSFGLDNNRQIIIPVNGGINNGESLKLSASVAYSSTKPNTVKVVLPQSAASAENSNNDKGEVSAVVEQLNEDNSEILEFGAQELPHDAFFNDSTKINIKRENLATTERTISAEPIEEYDFPQLLVGNGGGQNDSLQSQGSFDFEPETADSDNVYHIILTTSGPRMDGNTDGFVNFKQSEDIQLPSFEIQASASNPQGAVILPPPQLSNFTSSPLHMKSTTQKYKVLANDLTSTSHNIFTSTEQLALSFISTESPKHSSENGHHVEEEETALTVESNPAYPSLPEDDFSLRDVNFPINEGDDAVETDEKEEQRSIPFDVFRSRKPVEEGSGNGVEFMEASSTAIYEACVDCTTKNLSKLSAKVALFMNSAEDLFAETSIYNNSDFISDRFSRLAINATNSDSNESIEMQLTSELGSGDSAEVKKKLEKRREPTTPRPRPSSAVAIDIDELSGNPSGDGKSDPNVDPKLDAESIKADEDLEDGIVKQETGLKEDVLTVIAKPKEERTVEEVLLESETGRIQSDQIKN
nr:serine-rich adhesin for platelets isoform X2 [Bactrocera oleae]XP_036233559.1 serine-rich adhesin for platelets isoform X2 [Bactrocera oleae]